MDMMIITNGNIYRAAVLRAEDEVQNALTGNAPVDEISETIEAADFVFHAALAYQDRLDQEQTAAQQLDHESVMLQLDQTVDDARRWFGPSRSLRGMND